MNSFEFPNSAHIYHPNLFPMMGISVELCSFSFLFSSHFGTVIYLFIYIGQVMIDKDLQLHENVSNLYRSRYGEH